MSIFKKTKWVLASVIMAAMASLMIAANALAATSITNITLTVTEPTDKQLPAKQLTLDNPAAYQQGVNSLLWLKCSTTNPDTCTATLYDDETFVAGKLYAVKFYLATNDGYTFSQSPPPTVTVNGLPAATSGETDGYLSITSAVLRAADAAESATDAAQTTDTTKSNDDFPWLIVFIGGGILLVVVVILIIIVRVKKNTANKELH